MQTFPASHTLVTLGATVQDEEVDVDGCKVDVDLDHARNSRIKAECMRAVEKLWVSQCYRRRAPGGSLYK